MTEPWDWELCGSPDDLNHTKQQRDSIYNQLRDYSYTRCGFLEVLLPPEGNGNRLINREKELSKACKNEVRAKNEFEWEGDIVCAESIFIYAKKIIGEDKYFISST